MPPQIIYLHGFASSPRSRKATFFAQRLREAGREVLIPDLEQGDFAGTTVTNQLEFVERIMNGQKTVLVGSSLGGYLASLLAGRNDCVQKVVLLAPAFDFAELWTQELGPERISQWKQNGSINVFHYGSGREMPLRWSFLENARQYPLFPDFRQPALCFHGEYDTVVPVERSMRYAADHPNVRLTKLASGHELTDVLDRIWQEAKDFLLSGGPENRC